VDGKCHRKHTAACLRFGAGKAGPKGDCLDGQSGKGEKVR